MGIPFSIIMPLIVFCTLVVMGCTRKDWSCNCTVNGDDYSITIANSTKSQAGKKCGDYGKQIGSRPSAYVYKCKVN